VQEAEAGASLDSGGAAEVFASIPMHCVALSTLSEAFNLYFSSFSFPPLLPMVASIELNDSPTLSLHIRGNDKTLDRLL
jgi:hypothetical protein